MRILFLGDASNYHNSIANQLRKEGHEVVIASHGSKWMQTARDIDLRRKPGLYGGFKLYCRLVYLCLKEFRGFDIVQIHSPVFVDLRPHLVREIFESIKKRNGRIFMSALGTDTPYTQLCLDPDGKLKYNEFRSYGKPTPYAAENPGEEYAYTHPPYSAHSGYIYDNIDGAISALYEYHLALQTVLPQNMIAYAGIPIEMPAIPPRIEHIDGPVRIMVACHRGREKEKGIDVLLDAINRVVAANRGKATVDLVQNVPFDAFQRTLESAHIVVDQLYSYSPATTALMAMAKGKAVVSGGEEDYYRFIGESELRPIINPDPRDIGAFERQLDYLINNPDTLLSLMQQGPEFVARHNSAELVARRMLALWEKC